jgi:hypothetical protein
MRAFWLFGILVSLHVPITSNAAPPQASEIWLEARERTACEAMQDDYCLGRYGFAINHDGTFVAGPSNQGTKTEGRIEMGELLRLGELIEHLSKSLLAGRRACDSGGLVGIKDQVDLTLATGFVARLYELGNGRICYLGSKVSAKEFHSYVRSLMTKYYPIPFSIH